MLRTRKLTPEQQQVIKGTASQIEKQIIDASHKVAEDANKGLDKAAEVAKNAVDDAKKAISK